MPHPNQESITIKVRIWLSQRKMNPILTITALNDATCPSSEKNRYIIIVSFSDYVPPTPTPLVDLSISMVSPGGAEVANFGEGDDDDSGEETSAVTPAEQQSATDLPSAGGDAQPRRIAFLFDSTLTAFLMMGNLSTVRNCVYLV